MSATNSYTYAAQLGPDDFVDDVRGCARCHGDGHSNLIWRKLRFPYVDEYEGKKFVMTHWAICPTTGDPIMWGANQGERRDEELQARLDANARAALDKTRCAYCHDPAGLFVTGVPWHNECYKLVHAARRGEAWAMNRIARDALDLPDERLYPTRDDLAAEL